MMYYQDNKHRIQADMALRIGRIAMQYSQLVLPPKENFKDTLHLCLLQNLLTNCKELIDAMAWENGEELGLKVPISAKPDWGLDAVEIREDSFDGSLTVEVLLTHLRNSMCHPTGTNLDAEFPSTGYNSIPDSSGMIGAIGFCNSPDTRGNRPPSWKSEVFAHDYLLRGQKPSRASPWNKIPSDVQIGPIGYNGFGMFRFGRPFARVFVVVLTMEQLRSLVYGLSNLLAQPAMDHWDGKSIRPIISAA